MTAIEFIAADIELAIDIGEGGFGQEARAAGFGVAAFPGRSNDRAARRRHFWSAVKTVKPERPFRTVRAHDRIETLDRARRQAF
jgi:hypothetical protein